MSYIKQNNMIKAAKLFGIFLFWSCFMVSCKAEEVIDNTIIPEKETLLFSQTGGEETINIKSSLDWMVKISEEATFWCNATRQGSSLRVFVEKNNDSNERKTELKIFCGNIEIPIKVEQLGTTPAIKTDRTTLNVSGNELESSFEIVSNIEYAIVPENEWIKLKSITETRGLMQSRKAVLSFEKNTTGKRREGTVKITPDDDKYKHLEVNLKIVQNYNSDAGDIKDQQLEIIKAEANQQEKNQEWGKQDIMASCDGNSSTFYHSPWNSGKTTFPVVLTYYLKEESEIDYLIYIPRQDSNNGAWGKVKIEFAYNGNNDVFMDAVETDFRQQPKTAQKYNFEKTYAGVTAVRFTINSGLGNFVTCAELGLYKRNSSVDEEIEKIFTDNLCTELKPGITQEDIKSIKSQFLKDLAQKLYDGGYNEYDKQFRIQEYNPYYPINQLQKELKTQFGYNPFENPTGIFFNPEEDVVLFVEDTQNQQLTLTVYDFYNRSLGQKRETEVFPLSKGINVYKVKDGGLAYINYYTPDYNSVPSIKIHIATGQVNGYWELGKTQSKSWTEIINNAEYGHFDLKGKRVNICFPVWEEGGLRRYCTDPDELISVYDDYVGKEWDMMCLEKYGYTFPNHQFIRTVSYSPGAAAFADSWGVGIYNTSTDGFNNKTCKYKMLWTIAHEFGHTNQIVPQLHWVGLGEVTNNCYAFCIRHEVIPWYEKYEDETYNDGRGKSIAGGLVNKFINQHVLDKNASWLISNTDPFIKGIPFWQLLCYYRYVKPEHKDWYGDLIEYYRKTTDENKSNGEYQVLFMKKTCDVLKTDLTEFFENAAMLRPCDAYVEDYIPGQLKITMSQCEEVKNYAKKYPKPKAFLNYMSANAIRIFKEEQPVSGVLGNGITINGEFITINHKIWKNAIAFETYKDTELTNVSIMGTGISSSTGLTDEQPLPLPEKDFTEVYYPKGSTAIYAVSWDGKRTLVYGNSNGVEDNN